MTESRLQIYEIRVRRSGKLSDSIEALEKRFSTDVKYILGAFICNLTPDEAVVALVRDPYLRLKQKDIRELGAYAGTDTDPLEF